MILAMTLKNDTLEIMEIYLMRHGEPIQSFEWHDLDETRPLTDRGRLKLEEAVEKMKAKGFKPKAIVTSPFKRCYQSAEILCLLDKSLEPIVKTELASGASIKMLREMVLNMGDVDKFLFLGHMPEISHFGGGLASSAKLMEAGFKPGEIWALETGKIEEGWGTGKLLWQKDIHDW